LARILIVGCGCRGRMLARALIDRGHTVRGTSRDEASVARMREDGIDGVLADPDRVGTIVTALDGVTVACILLGSARGDVAELHGPRLEALMMRVVDTTVRGVVYEARGSVEPAVVEKGVATVTRICGLNRVPFALLQEPPEDHSAWVDKGLQLIGTVLSGRSS
jgi:nucleoside-diphosphate-sugar epimerase